MKIIDLELIDSVTEQAKKSPRLRMNHNFHQSLEAKVQYLLNALEPGTILPIHRHRNTAEAYFLIRGSLNVLFYNDSKELVEKQELNPTKGEFGINIDAGIWHSIEILESGTVIIEIKEGPYSPLSDEDIL
ncbi:MAG: WbuC family cupin fold metalloprotein [Paludibacter sp.]